MPKREEHKKIRLSRETYAQPGTVCSLTLAVRGRQAVFADHALASLVVQTLCVHAEQTGVPVYAYCVMPDHVHMVVSPSPTCDSITFVSQVKNLVLRAAWQCGVRGTFWQKSFWDHFLRGNDGVLKVVEYVLCNPVRKGLVDDWHLYPYPGSLVFGPEQLG